MTRYEKDARTEHATKKIFAEFDKRLGEVMKLDKRNAKGRRAMAKRIVGLECVALELLDSLQKLLFDYRALAGRDSYRGADNFIAIAGQAIADAMKDRRTS